MPRSTSSNQKSFPRLFATGLSRPKTPTVHDTWASCTTLYLRNVFLGSWLNLLLPLTPVGFAVYYALNSANPATAPIIFAVNFVALVPHIALLSYALSNIKSHYGTNVALLMNITFGNAAQFISTILLLVHNQIRILRYTLIGNVLTNNLLVIGVTFLAGGIGRFSQYFNISRSQALTALLLMAVVAIVVPTAFNLNNNRLLEREKSVNTAKLSRATAIVIFVCYLCWLLTSLRTHRDVYHEPATFAPPGRPLHESPRSDDSENDDDETPEPELSVIPAFFTLLWSTTLLGFHAEFLTNSLTGILHVGEGSVTSVFLGLIIIPLISIDPASVEAGIKDEIDDSLVLTLERSIQLVFAVLPLTVILGWVLGKESMTLDFDSLTLASLFLSTILLSVVIGHGTSHWLTGVILLQLYLVMALSAWYSPG